MKLHLHQMEKFNFAKKSVKIFDKMTLNIAVC